MIELLSRLTSVNGVSGNEEEIGKVIEEEIRPYVDEVRRDALGNLICVKKGGGKRIMLAAHMDEVGIIVTHIDDNGFLRFAAMGGVNHFSSLYQRVVFKNGVVGAVGFEEELDELKDLKINKMYIDVGAKTKEEAEQMVQTGDVAAFEGILTSRGDRVISKALDDRVGCAVLIETAKRLKGSNHEIIYVFTVQEELGLRGAKPAAYSVEPEMAFVIDVSGTGDTPKAKPLPLKCGNGPMIKIMDRASIIHPEMKELLIRTAKENNIPYQLKVAAVGGTDAGAIHLSREGVPTANIAVPCRYLHSPVEMVDINDVKNAVRLLEKAISAV